MRLLEGLDGINKMCKSLGNYVGITDAPDEMFGKLMSISDELMWRYFELLSFRPLADVAALHAGVAAGRNPRDVKFELAQEIVARFHDAAAAQQAQRTFISRFADKVLPSDLKEVPLACAPGEAGGGPLGPPPRAGGAPAPPPGGGPPQGAGGGGGGGGGKGTHPPPRRAPGAPDTPHAGS